ncbi:hypothetical protein EYZ11_001795 [Aspergillus tanneri]|uniref:Methyltransferase-domain-containing protein n=1 Tax=Aspergillus tanneri TaxID=1220188 RepID=A0A4S3JSI4_9EURO|nr:hypothetical protein EYZ11_001795 [Aspergillus tanneri]
MSSSSSAPVDQVDLLIRQFHQQVDPALLPLPQGATIIHPALQSAIYESMFNEASVWPLPPIYYQARVLKMILSRIEEAIADPEEDEIHADLIETWTSLISQPKPSTIQQAQQLSYIKYTSPIPPPPTSQPRTVITSESRGLILSGGTTGFRTWEAALHLGTYLSTPAGESIISDKRVIELGAGTGFVSMFCAAHLHPQYILATDREPALIENIRDCARRNQLQKASGSGSTQFGAAIWEWGTPLDIFSEDSHGDNESSATQPVATTGTVPGDKNPRIFDVALGADLIYDVDLIPHLLSTLHDLFDNYRISQFIISATLRNQNTFQTFLSACGSSCRLSSPLVG